MKISEQIKGLSSGGINKYAAAQLVEGLEAEIDEANQRCQRLTTENNRLREIVGSSPQMYTDRQRAITVGDLEAFEARIMKALEPAETVVVQESRMSLLQRLRKEAAERGDYPVPTDDSIIEGGRGITRSDGSVDALRFLEALSGPLTFGRMLRSIRVGEEEGVADFAVKLCIPVEDLEPIENDRASVSDEQAVEFARILGYSENQFVSLARSQRLGRLVGADRVAP